MVSQPKLPKTSNECKLFLTVVGTILLIYNLLIDEKNVFGFATELKTFQRYLKHYCNEKICFSLRLQEVV